MTEHGTTQDYTKLNFHKYGKIQSLFQRDEDGKFINKWSVPEFQLIREWGIYEKIDGTNIRIGYQAPIGGHQAQIFIGGRTDKADIPKPLYERLVELFPLEKMQALFGESNAVLYGEGVGPKIQDGRAKGHLNYDFILFDAIVRGKFQEDLSQLAEALGIKPAPYLGSYSPYASDCDVVDGEPHAIGSTVLKDLCEKLIWSLSPKREVGQIYLFSCDLMTHPDKIEGIILRPGGERTPPFTLFTQKGERLIFKLKVSDIFWN